MMTSYKIKEPLTVYKVVKHPAFFAPAFARLRIDAGEDVIGQVGKLHPKFRCGRAFVEKIVDALGEPLDTAGSWWCHVHQLPFQYSAGKYITVKMDRSNESCCASGIHFYHDVDSCYVAVMEFFPSYREKAFGRGMEEVKKP